MRILQLSAYFEPEKISSSHLTNDLYNALAENHIEVEDYVPTPCRGITEEERNKYKKIKYEEKYNGYYKVHRFSMFKEGKNPLFRAFRYVLVNIFQLYKGSQAKNIDAIFAMSTPPTQGLMCGLVKKNLSRKYKKNIPFIYVLQDVFPDSLVNAGLTKKESILWKIGRMVENFTYKTADRIIVISDSIKKNIIDKGVVEDKIEVISNWVDLKKVYPIDKKNNNLFRELGIDCNNFIVTYAGNFGESQGASIVLDVAKRLIKYDDIQFVIFGEGTHFSETLNKANELKNIVIHRYLKEERLSEVYSLGDISLITCKKGAGKACLPSKLYNIMACNTPIVAAFDSDSELSSILSKSNSGEIVCPESVGELYNAILSKYHLWASDKLEKVNSRKYLEKHASKDICVKKYINILEELNEQTYESSTD